MLKALKRVMRYIKDTLAADDTPRKSTLGFCLMIFICAATMGSKIQSSVSPSPTKVEYVALDTATTEAR